MSKTSNPLAIVILAAGKGTRMKSDAPKVMHELAGRPMINWLLETCESLNPEKIITVIGPDMPDLKAAVAPHDTVVQETRDGTGGALKCALPKLKRFKGDVLVLLGDAPLVSKDTLKSLIAAKNKAKGASLSVLGMDIADPTGYGRLVQNKDGSLAKIVEEKDAKAKEKDINLVNTGAFCIYAPPLERWVSKLTNKNKQGEYYITDLPEIAAKDQAKTVLAITKDADEIRGCNTRSDLAKLEKTLQGRLREAAMSKGVSMIDPETVYLWHDTKIAVGTTIEPNVFFGPGVRVDDGAHIKAFCHFEGVHIKSGASIGPFARLRPETEIGIDARIGNFVEIKKSKIGKGSKIGHLAYVGDTKMGEDVNFSAGAITVNYDGFQKHETNIGKGVMVGSNVNLVAPVTLDDGAFIAAGSTITQDVPADSLSIARDTAEIRKGWAAKYRKIKAAAKKKRKKAS